MPRRDGWRTRKVALRGAPAGSDRL